MALTPTVLPQTPQLAFLDTITRARLCVCIIAKPKPPRYVHVSDSRKRLFDELYMYVSVSSGMVGEQMPARDKMSKTADVFGCGGRHWK